MVIKIFLTFLILQANIYFSYGFLRKITKIHNENEMNIMQLVKSHGYPIFNYQAVTDDGYKIEIFRIPGPRY